MSGNEPHRKGSGEETVRARICRTAKVPDRMRLARYLKAPEFGPRVLFFSGGNALNPLSRRLTEYTHNSIHLITPFDSGGSSAKLRDAFGVLGVGDFRSRLMALADHTVKGQENVFALLSYRLAAEESQAVLRQQLQRMIAGEDPLVARIMDPMRKLICNHLYFLAKRMPETFDLRGASIGNLVLVGGYLNNNEDIEPILFLFSKLVEVQGTVRPIVNQSLHLAAELEDGTTLIGQHRITGKEMPPIRSRIKRLLLVDSKDDPRPASPKIDEHTRRLIRKADLICYPMGSFYTSVLANLLPEGAAETIAAAGCPKVYIPNTGRDPEQYGMSLTDCVRTLLDYATADGSPTRTEEASSALTHVLLDSRDNEWITPADLRWIGERGIDVVDLRLGSGGEGALLDEDRVLAGLLSLT